MIDLIKVFTLATKVLINIECTILKLVEFPSQEIYNLMKLIAMIKKTWILKILLVTSSIKKDILDADESILELHSIPHKGFDTNLHSEESHASSLLSDILDSLGDW